MSASTVSLVLVGAGPRTVTILERISANAPVLLAESDLHFDVTLIDPHPAGSGRVWRHQQFGGLLLNSLSKDITLYTDETVTCDGPVVPGPDLVEWVAALREGTLEDPVEADPALSREIAELGPETFPSRQIFGLYVRWALNRAVRDLGDRATVRVVEDTVLRVEDRGADSGALDAEAHDAGQYRAHLASGGHVDGDLVFYSLGHSDSLSTGREDELSVFARDHGALYYPPAYTADVDYSAIPAGQDVIVSGMGLAFIDVLVLLFLGRGGAFEKDPAGKLSYVASGNEPVLWAGSRRGVPYHSKPQAALTSGNTFQARYFTQDSAAALLAEHALVDFDAHIWPLIAKDLIHAHYREVLHEDQDTLESLTAVLDAHPHNSAEFVAAAESAVADPERRLSLAVLDKPLAHLAVPGVTAAQREAAVKQHILSDLRIRSAEEGLPETTALFTAILFSYGAVQLLIPGERLSAASQKSMRVWLHGFFSYVDSGPPPERLLQLLALHDAGLVRFLGPDVSVGTDAVSGKFVARAAGLGDVVSASAFIEARLPETVITGSGNAALVDLVESGLGREAPLVPGHVDVNDLGHLLAPDGSVQERVFAGGLWTTAWGATPFARPRTNSPGFRANDAIAREIIAVAQRVLTANLVDVAA